MDKSSLVEQLKFYEKKRILVSGGCGYIGTYLIDLLKNINCKIISLDRQHATFINNNRCAQIVDIDGDIKERKTWESVLVDIDIIFHFAAQTSVRVANENPRDDLNINVIPMLHLLETCRQNNYKPTVLFSSTVTISGIPINLPVNESHPDNPISVYDLHKLMAENYLKYYSNQKIVNGVILRLANVYGPGPRSSSSDRGILNSMVRKALNGESLTLYGNGDFLRDYIYVEDVAMAFLLAGTRADILSGNHFIIGTGTGYTLFEAFKLVAERVGLKTKRIVDLIKIPPPVAQSPIDLRNFVADSSNFAKVTGWKANFNLIDGIDITIESLIND